MGSHRHLINTSSQSSLLFRRFSSLRRPIASSSSSPRKYSGGGETASKDNGGNVGREEERAPSILEEFKRISQEKAEMERVAEAKEQQGCASQTIDKAQDGASAAISGAGVEVVKEEYKEPVGVGNFHRSADDDELPRDRPKPSMNFNRTRDFS